MTAMTSFENTLWYLEIWKVDDLTKDNLSWTIKFFRLRSFSCLGGFGLKQGILIKNKSLELTKL